MRKGAVTIGLCTLLLAGGCGAGSDVTIAPENPAVPTSAGARTGAIGDTFVDPQGTYTITIGDDWTAQSGTVVKEIEVWSVPSSSSGFAANVNVLTQSAPGMDLQQYMDASVQSMGELKLLDQQLIDGAKGNRLGLIEYSGVMSARPLHFLAVFEVRNDQAVVATFTADETSFDSLRPNIEPFLRTLQGT